MTALALQGLALLLFGLHLYVRLALPPSPPNTVPDAASVETAWWGLWPVQYLAPWQVALGGAAIMGAIAAGWLLRPQRDILPAALRPYLLPLAAVLLFIAF